MQTEEAMAQRAPDSRRPSMPSWLIALGVVSLTAIAAAAAYAVAIAAANFSRIGV
jgi:hypothetical protein